MGHRDAGHALEQLAAQMHRGTVAARCRRSLARVDLGMRDEVRHRFRRRGIRHHHDIRLHADQRDGGEVRHRVVVERGVKEWVHREAGRRRSATYSRPDRTGRPPGVRYWRRRRPCSRPRPAGPTARRAGWRPCVRSRRWRRRPRTGTIRRTCRLGQACGAWARAARSSAPCVSADVRDSPATPRRVNMQTSPMHRSR